MVNTAEVCQQQSHTFLLLLGFQFPETRADKIPETMEEAMALGKNVKRNWYGAVIID